MLAALEARGLAPVTDADRARLLRRLTFDLIGLPPKPEELAAFLADDSAEALAAVVDRLLGSPHFGERWARHWLDVARYAESSGTTNFTNPRAWRYRDWVRQRGMFLTRAMVAGTVVGGSGAQVACPERLDPAPSTNVL